MSRDPCQSNATSGCADACEQLLQREPEPEKEVRKYGRPARVDVLYDRHCGTGVIEIKAHVDLHALQ